MMLNHRLFCPGVMSKVSKNSIIEDVAEKLLTQDKSVIVIDENDHVVGTIHPSKIINTVFGGRKNNS